MKKFTTTFFLLMAMVLLLPTEVGAWDDIKIHSNFKGWDQSGSDFNLNRVDDDDNNRYGVFDATGLTNGTIYEFVLQDVNNGSVTNTYKGGFEYNFNKTGEQSYNLSNSGDNLRLVHNSKYKSYKFYATWNNGWTLKIIGVEGGGSETSSIIFYVSTFNDPNIYTWDPDNRNKEYSGSFPGLKGSAYPKGFDSKMTIEKVTDTNNADWYKVTVTGTSTLKLILNNDGDNDKTGDITIQNNKSYTYKGNKDYTSEDEPTIGGGDQPVSGIDPNAYYLVSPELTDGKLLPNFKMIASRHRTSDGGDGKASTSRYTINFKQDEIKSLMKANSQTGTNFHWYISRGDKFVQYRPKYNNNFKLGIDGEKHNKTSNANVETRKYNDSKTDANNTCVFEMPVEQGVSYTIFLNTDGPVSMNVNKNSLVKDPAGYYLIGNFSSAKGSVKIDPSKKEGDTYPNRKEMTMYRYKDGFRYDATDTYVTDEEADSIVYVVHVEKPADGWGDLYMDVATAKSIRDYTDTWENNGAAWNTVIRPQVSSDGIDVDGRALKGGLVQGLSTGVLMSLNPEVDGDLYDSYDFSMNITTCTYRLVFNTNLYIVGDAVSTMDGTTGNGFDLSKDKIQLTYDSEEGCYKYEGDGGMLHFDNGEQFRFVVNGNSYKLNYSENVNEPYEKDGEGKYAKKTVNGETQYRNTVLYHSNGNNSTTDPNASVDRNHNVTFALGTGSYVLRFYLPQDNEPYYTISESANLVLNPDDKTYAWGDAVTPTGRVIYSNNETWGEREFIFTVDGSTPKLLDDGQLPINTTSATGTNIVRYNHDHLGAFGTIAAAIKGTADKKITFNDIEISPAISTSGNVIVKAYPVVVDPDAGYVKYKVDGDMQSVVYKFRDEVIIEIQPMAGKFIRTFSHGSNIELPEDGSVKAYEAYRYEQPTEADKKNKKHGKIYLRRLIYIPANMGVVLVGETEEKTFVSHLIVRTENLVEKNEDLWMKKSSYTSDEWNNYLEPAVTGVPNLGNTLEDGDGKILARYFGLGHFYNTNEYKNHPKDYTDAEDYIGFFRLTSKGRCGANKAYLSIPAVENERSQKYGYIDFNGQWLDDIYDDPGNGYQSYAKAALIFDDIYDTPTGITTVETDGNETSDNAYYTLQGIKVSKPVQGVYIHNGKKVIIK